MHFLGIHWDNKDKKPLYKFRNVRYDTSVHLADIIVGEEVTFKVLDKRYCIGHTDGGGEMNHLCKTAIAGEELTSSQCDICRQQDSLYFTHLNGLKVNQLNELKNKPSINYINIFGNKLLKTGVTGVDRKVTRVLEQGAFATMFFTLTDAYTSRIIENLVSQVLLIKQAYSWGTKIKYLAEPITNEESHMLLTSTIEQVRKTLNKNYDNSLLSIPEYHYNYEKYFLQLPNNLEKIFLTEHISYGDIISGKIMGIYGQIILLLQEDQSIIGINMKALQGYLLNISNNKTLNEFKVKPKMIELYKAAPENLTLF